MDPLIEARTAAHRRLAAAFLGRPEAPSPVRPLILGGLLAVALAAVEIARALW
ncbi:hypothetical protein [Nocardioides sp.]|uniref:hypothetical protein n=1 Tax=Nocardioides sp. TaxID=35761 RepID=UPI0039E63153